MFGLWRTLLALCVVAFHLLLIPVIGYYAVFSFFVLSGFLMTTIMHESYGYGPEGLRRYALNRFLRLYPSYWFAAAIGLLVIYVCGVNYVREFKPGLFRPEHLSSIIFNVTMIFPKLIPEEVWPRLAPPTWALTIEITYYVAIGLGASKTKKRALIWLVASLVYTAVTLALHLSFKYRYGAIPAGALPFASGACLYFYKADVRSLLQKCHLGFWAVAAIYAGVFVAFAGLAFMGHTRIEELGLYVTIAAAALLLTKLNYDGVPGLTPRIDKLVGDFSYPIYLVHWQLAALSSYLLLHRPELGPTGLSAMLFALTLTLVGIVAAFMIFVIDPTIERARARIRRGALAGARA